MLSSTWFWNNSRQMWDFILWVALSIISKNQIIRITHRIVHITRNCFFLPLILMFIVSAVSEPNLSLYSSIYEIRLPPLGVDSSIGALSTNFSLKSTFKWSLLLTLILSSILSFCFLCLLRRGLRILCWILQPMKMNPKVTARPRNLIMTHKLFLQKLLFSSISD